MARAAGRARRRETLVRTMVGGVRAIGEAASGRDALRAVFEYLVRVRTEPRSELLRVIDVLGEELGNAKEAAMNTAEQLEAYGAARALRATLLKQIKLRFGAVPAAVAARIDAADAEDLDRWTERVLDAASADEVVAAQR
jgi:hypothetical protein